MSFLNDPVCPTCGCEDVSLVQYKMDDGYLCRCVECDEYFIWEDGE